MLKPGWLVEDNPQETLHNLLGEADAQYLLSLSDDDRAQAIINEVRFLGPDPAIIEQIEQYIRENPNEIRLTLSY